MSKKNDFRMMKTASPKYILFKFVQKDFMDFLRFCYKFIRKRNFKRDTEFVSSIYETRRLDQIKNYTFTTLDEYAFGSPTSNEETKRWNLYKGKLKFGVHKEITEYKYSLLEDKIRTIDMKYIVELGSGGGRNILYLAQKFPEKRFVGIELSPISVELSKLAAIEFRLSNVDFFAKDLTKPDTYSDLIQSSSLVFSMHCLEEMPRIFKIPLILMKEKKVQNIFLLEPAFLLQPKRHFLELARLLRIIHHDRLWGLPGFCKMNFTKNYDLTMIDLGMGNNPVNPSSLVDIKLKNHQASL